MALPHLRLLLEEKAFARIIAHLPQQRYRTAQDGNEYCPAMILYNTDRRTHHDP